MGTCGASVSGMDSKGSGALPGAVNGLIAEPADEHDPGRRSESSEPVAITGESFKFDNGTSGADSDQVSVPCNDRLQIRRLSDPIDAARDNPALWDCENVNH